MLLIGNVCDARMYARFLDTLGRKRRLDDLFCGCHSGCLQIICRPINRIVITWWGCDFTYMGVTVLANTIRNFSTLDVISLCGTCPVAFSLLRYLANQNVTSKRKQQPGYCSYDDSSNIYICNGTEKNDSIALCAQVFKCGELRKSSSPTWVC